MPFTSSSTNKNNKFRLQAEKKKILLCIGEYAVYTITQKYLFNPVYDKDKFALQQVSCIQAKPLECIDLETILASCLRQAQTVLFFCTGKAAKIIS